MQLVQLPQTTSCSTDRHLETSFGVMYIRCGGGPLHQSGPRSRQHGSSGQLCIICSLLQTFISACVCIKSAGSPKLPPPASQIADDTAPTAWHPSADAPLGGEDCPTSRKAARCPWHCNCAHNVPNDGMHTCSQCMPTRACPVQLLPEHSTVSLPMTTATQSLQLPQKPHTLFRRKCRFDHHTQERIADGEHSSPSR